MRNPPSSCSHGQPSSVCLPVRTPPNIVQTPATSSWLIPIYVLDKTCGRQTCGWGNVGGRQGTLQLRAPSEHTAYVHAQQPLPGVMAGACALVGVGTVRQLVHALHARLDKVEGQRAGRSTEACYGSRAHHHRVAALGKAGFLQLLLCLQTGAGVSSCLCPEA